MRYRKDLGKHRNAAFYCGSGGCTLWPDRWGSYDLSAACMIHDEDYAGQTGFWTANIALYRNVWAAGTPVLAAVMFAGVTVFGYPFYAAAKK